MLRRFCCCPHVSDAAAALLTYDMSSKNPTHGHVSGTGYQVLGPVDDKSTRIFVQHGACRALVQAAALRRRSR